MLDEDASMACNICVDLFGQKPRFLQHFVQVQRFIAGVVSKYKGLDAVANVIGMRRIVLCIIFEGIGP